MRAYRNRREWRRDHPKHPKPVYGPETREHWEQRHRLKELSSIVSPPLEPEVVRLRYGDEASIGTRIVIPRFTAPTLGGAP